MLVDGEMNHHEHHNQTLVVELEFKIGEDLTNLGTIGEIGVGINHFLTFGTMTLGGDKEV
jgi:hypothetical protein